jgi:hypothetical protein
MNRIPITKTPGQATAIAIKLDNSSPYVFRPAPHNIGYILSSMIERIRNAIMNALVVIGWIMWAVVILAAASPTLEGHIEDFVVSVLYELT